MDLWDESERFELPISGGRRDFRYELAAEGPTEVTIKLQKKGTQVMDGGEKRAARKDEAQVRNLFDWGKDAIKTLLE